MGLSSDLERSKMAYSSPTPPPWAALCASARLGSFARWTEVALTSEQIEMSGLRLGCSMRNWARDTRSLGLPSGMPDKFAQSIGWLVLAFTAIDSHSRKRLIFGTLRRSGGTTSQ